MTGREGPRYKLYESFAEMRKEAPEQLRRALLELELAYGNIDEDEDDYGDANKAYVIMAYMNFGDLYDKQMILNGIKKSENRTAMDS